MSAAEPNLVSQFKIQTAKALGASGSELKQSADNPQIIQLHYFIDPQNLGDKNHALGIITALKKISHEQKISCEAQEWNENHYTQFLESIKKQLAQEKLEKVKHIVLGINVVGLTILDKLSKDLEQCLRASNLQASIDTVWSGHQIIQGLEKLLNNINILALPQSAVTSDETFCKKIAASNTVLLKMFGVPHNVNSDTIEAAFKKWQAEFSPKIIDAKSYILVVLGGDAPDERGVQKYFTPKEAESFANYIANQAKQFGAMVLVTNGPRTGKFDSAGNDRKLHQEGSKLDPTTESFITVLSSRQIPHQLFNFVFGKTSAYQALLHIAKNNNTLSYVTGESSSMVSEMLDILSPGKLGVVLVESMNKTHLAHVDALSKLCSVQIFDFDKTQPTLVERKQSNSTDSKQNSSYESAAETLAKSILELNKHGVEKRITYKNTGTK